MKKIKIYTGAITLVIVGLMIAVSASAMVQIPEEENTFKLKKVEKAIVGMDIVKAKTLETQLKYPSAAPIDAILVVDGHHPAVASDSAYAVLGFEDIDYENVWFTASPDAGQTWIDNAAGWIIPEPPELPDADSCGDGRFLGGMVPNYLDFEGGALYKVKIADPLDIPGGYTCSYWNWNDLSDPNKHFNNFISIACGGYTSGDPAEDSWAFGGHSIVGDYVEDSPPVHLSQIAIFSYQMTSDGYAWIFRWTEINGCTSTSHDIDSDTLYSYAVWNWANPDNGGLLDIFFYIADFGEWETEQGYPIHPDDPPLGGWTMSTEGNDEYVDVSAYMDNVIIVSQNGDDIVAYYSHNAMVDISETTIATGGYVNPRIVHIDENNATCLVIKEEVVYFSTTEDGGVTWSPMEAVEDSDYVPTEYKRADVCGFGAAYESEDEIYFAPLWGGPGAILEIMSISGGIGVSAVIKNTGGADATNVKWNITVTGGLFGLINKETTDTITTLAVDAEETVKSGLIVGLGPIAITVTATADGAMSGEESADAKVLFFIVTPKDIFP